MDVLWVLALLPNLCMNSNVYIGHLQQLGPQLQQFLEDMSIGDTEYMLGIHRAAYKLYIRVRIWWEGMVSEL